MTPVEEAFRDIRGRPKWAIPWLEDDPALISPQLWVGRMRKDAKDALDYGCTGLMGIHWRTRVLGPNVAALAQAAWDQGDWGRYETTEGERDLPADDFYRDWAVSQFGEGVAREAASIFARLDGGPLYLRGENLRKANLPRSSMWHQGPGAVISRRNESVHIFDSRAEMDQAFSFIEELEDLRGGVQGKGNLERFDYWLNTFKFAKATSQLGFVLDELDRTVETVHETLDTTEKAQIVVGQAIPLRVEAATLWEEMSEKMLAVVSNMGELGTIANLEQHNLGRLNLLGKHDNLLTEFTGQPLPASTSLKQEYGGPLRVIVPTKRTMIEDGEDLVLRVRVLSRQAVTSATMYWRHLGASRFTRQPLTHLSRSVYQVTLDKERFAGEDFEYYIDVENPEDRRTWPVTAPEINHSVVVFP